MNLDSSTNIKAKNLKKNLQSSEFIAGICVTRYIMRVSKNLTLKLQSKQNLISESLKYVKSFIKVLENDIKANYFDTIFEDAKTLASNINVMLTMNRNSEDSNKKKYWSNEIFIPAITAIIDDLKSRSGISEKKMSTLENLFSIKSININEIETKEICCFYLPILKEYSTEIDEVNELLKLEIRQYGSIIDEFDIDRAISETKVAFPILHKLFYVLKLVPSSTVTAERCFSYLRRLKTYLRNTMTEKRLSNLSVIYLNKDICSETAEVVQKFSILSSRKLDFFLS